MSSTAVIGRHRATGTARAAIGAPSPATGRPGAGPTAAATVATGRRTSWSRRLVSLLGTLSLVACTLVFLLLAVGPHVLGYRTSTMLTGSMAPGIMPGDVVVTTPEPAADLQVGDVVSYHIPVEDHRVETHRVTKVIHHVDGSIAIRTKGDANDNVDPWTATLQGDTVWKMRAVVPHLGTAIRVLRAPAVQHGIVWAAMGGLLLLGLSMIWSEPRDDLA